MSKVREVVLNYMSEKTVAPDIMSSCMEYLESVFSRSNDVVVNVQVKSVYLKNFLAHKEFQMNFVQGKPILLAGPVGSGKSSILEAIPWCLYGKMSTGGSLATVISLGESEAVVELCLVSNGVTYEIRRKVSKGAHSISMTMGSVPVSSKSPKAMQDLINSAIGVSEDEFLSLYFVTPDTSFLSLSDTKKKLLMESVAGGTIFSDAIDAYKADKKIQRLEQELNLLNAQLDIANTLVPVVDTTELEERLQREKDTLNDFVKQKAKLERDEQEALFNKLDVLPVVFSRLFELESIEKDIQYYRILQAERHNNIRKAEQDLELLEDARDTGVCVTCGQPTVLSDVQISELNRIKDFIAKESLAHKAQEESLSRMLAQHSELQMERQREFGELYKHNQKALTLSNALCVTQAYLGHTKASIAKTKKSIQDLEIKISNIKPDLSNTAVTRLISSIDKITADLEREKAVALHLGPMGILYYYASQLLNDLNTKVNDFVSRLNFPYSIRVNPDKEYKTVKGKDSKITIICSPVPYETLSRGEKRLVGIILWFSLLRLYEESKGRFNLVVFDDADAFLSIHDRNLLLAELKNSSNTTFVYGVHNLIGITDIQDYHVVYVNKPVVTKGEL